MLVFTNILLGLLVTQNPVASSARRWADPGNLVDVTPQEMRWEWRRVLRLSGILLDLEVVRESGAVVSSTAEL